MDIRIYIIGQLHLQNHLLKDYFATHLAVDCQYGMDLDIIPPAQPSATPVTPIVLWDCLSNTLNILWQEMDKGFSSSHPECQFVLFNFRSDSVFYREALDKGVRGIFFDGDTPEQMVRGLKAIAGGDLWLPRDVMARLLFEHPSVNGKSSGKSLLSFREREILGCIVAGKSNSDIADELCISIHTVKTHIYNIFKKIEVTNRLQAALWAAKNLTP